MKRTILFLILFLLSLNIVFADNAKISLLAVTEIGNGTYQGSIAQLNLEIKQGSGRVFIDTFPITKLDTQMTTRFAKEMACKFLEKDCSHYDFFYRIRANSPIVAGPSAGAATTFLTMAVLENWDFDENTVITGTINSGYLVGPVGGVSEKITVAQEKGFHKVLIPRGEFSSNKSELSHLLNGLNITVVEVSNIEDVIFEFTGKNYNKNYPPLRIDETYNSVMRSLALDLCNRSENFKRQLNGFNFSNFENILNQTKKAKAQFELKNYYSSASLCFVADTIFLKQILLQGNLTNIEYSLESIKLKNEIDSFTDKINSLKINTITDLESKVIVRERLVDARYYADLAITSNFSEKATKLAYAKERFNSARLWFKFYGLKGKRIILDKEALKESCQLKISESEERYQYLKLYFPDLISDIRKEIDRAYSYFESGEYEFCLFTASKAKARSNIVLSSLSLVPDRIGILVEQKINAAKNTVSEQIEKGNFPISGYSYLEYAQTLNETDPYSSLVYSEYSLELSNSDIYFKPEKNFVFSFDYNSLYLFLSGVFTGVIVSFLIRKKSFKKNKKLFKKKKQ